MKCATIQTNTTAALRDEFIKCYKTRLKILANLSQQRNAFYQTVIVERCFKPVIFDLILFISLRNRVPHWMLI